MLFISQLKKDAYFDKSVEFAVIYGQLILLMASLQKEQAVHMGFLDKFDQKRAEETSQQELEEMEEAMLFYIDFFKKIPFPDTKILDLLMGKIGVADNFKPQFSVKLREFNQQALAEFSRL